MTSDRDHSTLGILALDTATDACTLALRQGDSIAAVHEVIPRQHSQRILPLLERLLPGGNVSAAGVSLIAYGEGPGSFTGLRIAASAAQGIAFAAELPAVAVSTLACQAATAAREGLVDKAVGTLVLSTIDARIDELYFALYRITEGVPETVMDASHCAPEALPLGEMAVIAGQDPIHVVGSGAMYAARFPTSPLLRVPPAAETLLPNAVDMIALAEHAHSAGHLLKPEQIVPRYVQESVGWKKLAEQGKGR